MIDHPTPEEKQFLDELSVFLKEETGYQWIQGTKPTTLSFGLTDSPTGLAAWVVEKFHTWTDCGGDIESAVSKDELLTNIMLYWLTGAIGAMAFDFSLRLFAVVAYGLSALFLGLYIIIDRDRLRGGLFALIPRSHHIRLSRIMMNLETIVVAYVRGQMITCLLMALFTYGLLWACGVENALALAAIAGLADVLPYIGPLLSVGPAVLAALSHGPVVTVVVLVLMLAYEEFESRVLIPRIYGRALRLPSSVVLFALLAGGTLMGIFGALLALPVAATVMMLIEELRVELPGEQEQPVDTLMREADDRGEEEYERRTAGIGAEQAAAIAVEISRDRQEDEKHPPEAAGTPIEGGNANGHGGSTAPVQK